MTEFIDAYAVLGVDPQCSQTELDAARRRLVRRHHPDVVPPHEREAATAASQRINVAYALVRDPDRRARYDELRASQAEVADRPHDVALAEHWEQMVTAAGRWAGQAWQRHRPPPAPAVARGLGRMVGTLARSRRPPRG